MKIIIDKDILKDLIKAIDKNCEYSVYINCERKTVRLVQHFDYPHDDKILYESKINYFLI